VVLHILPAIFLGNSPGLHPIGLNDGDRNIRTSFFGFFSTPVVQVNPGKKTKFPSRFSCRPLKMTGAVESDELSIRYLFE
jgi:hypothetical protein